MLVASCPVEYKVRNPLTQFETFLNTHNVRVRFISAPGLPGLSRGKEEDVATKGTSNVSLCGHRD